MAFKILWPIFVIAVITRGIAGDGSNPFARIGEPSPSSVEVDKSAEIAASKGFTLESNLDAGGDSSQSTGGAVDVNKSAGISASKSAQLDANLDAGAAGSNPNSNGGGSIFSNAFNRLSDIFSLNGNGNANAGLNADFHVGGANDGQVVNFGSPDANQQAAAVDNSSTTSSTSTTPAPDQSSSTESIIILTTPAPTPPTVWPTSSRPKYFYPYPSHEQRPVSPKFPNSNFYYENNNAVDNPQDC